MEADEEELFIETREEFSTLITITVLTVMGDHVYGSSLHDGIDEPQFHYGFHTVGPKFDDDILMTIGKIVILKRMMIPTIDFRMGKGL